MRQTISESLVMALMPSRSMFLSFGKWPQTVLYVNGKTFHVPSDNFYTGSIAGPSDCEWIVPGTGEA